MDDVPGVGGVLPRRAVDVMKSLGVGEDDLVATPTDNKSNLPSIII